MLYFRYCGDNIIIGKKPQPVDDVCYESYLVVNREESQYRKQPFWTKKDLFLYKPLTIDAPQIIPLI